MPVSYCSNVPAKFTYLCPRPNQSLASSSGSGQPSNMMDALNARFDKRISDKLRPTLTSRLAKKTVLLLDQILLPLPPLIPWCLPNPNPSMGPVAPAKAFVGQIFLNAITYPKSFPTNASKVVFAVLFMKDYTATRSQPYQQEVGEKGIWEQMLQPGIELRSFGSEYKIKERLWSCAQVDLNQGSFVREEDNMYIYCNKVR
ncbi:uncharacterized protein VP01_1403g1 [Puccinia sorghi]|uniref:Uncharacterized protein n=1 Tax=Puccinia sorghi TaxID=27349 RepID=A0A0L6VKX3_9BASI|nr:uncharacterized protein VP01_1403g1 [Puccinia sorghi]